MSAGLGEADMGEEERVKKKRTAVFFGVERHVHAPPGLARAPKKPT